MDSKLTTSIVTDYCSLFHERGVFGAYPTHEMVNMLEENGVDLFVNLVYEDARLSSEYTTTKEMIRYPIKDQKAPEDLDSFNKLLFHILRHIHNGGIVYIHCIGGHGRSGLVVACLVCYLYRVSSDKAVQMTTEYHSARKIMRDRWRRMGSPQTVIQKKFVYQTYRPLLFYKTVSCGNTKGMSLHAPYSVAIDNFGVFPTLYEAFSTYKRVKGCLPFIELRSISGETLRGSWDDIKYNVMYTMIKKRYEQNPELVETLLSTGIRPILYHTDDDTYWGNGVVGNGENKLGALFEIMREEFFLRDF
jgi:protein-tyrosine phosphatase